MKKEKKIWYFYYYISSDFNKPIYFGKCYCKYPEKSNIYKKQQAQRVLNDWAVIGYSCVIPDGLIIPEK